jgi:hypothetical protein
MKIDSLDSHYTPMKIDSLDSHFLPVFHSISTSNPKRNVKKYKNVSTHML